MRDAHKSCTPGSYDGDVIVQDARGRPINVDPCIADLVAALNRGGVPTCNSCCGHGEGPGSIALSDGRWVLVLADWDEWKAVDSVVRGTLVLTENADAAKERLRADRLERSLAEVVGELERLRAAETDNATNGAGEDG